MKKIALAALAVFVVAGTGSAMAGEAGKSGIYLRADGGYSWARDANIRNSGPGIDLGGGGAATNQLFGEVNEIGDSPLVQAGVGYRISPAFRVDLTGGYRWGFKLDDTDSSPNTATGSTYTLGTAYKADIRSTAVMLNGYVDIGGLTNANLGVFKPYVGGGLGWAHNKVKTLRYQNTDAGLEFTGEGPGGVSNDLAWQLSVGTGISLSQNLLLDVGYRYSSLGEVKTESGFNQIFDGNGTDVSGHYDGTVGKLRSHDLMIGIRYEL